MYFWVILRSLLFPLYCRLCLFQVKIKNWVNGVESTSVVGLSARFGTSLPTHASEALKTPTVLANPFNCCTDSSIEVLSSFHLNIYLLLLEVKLQCFFPFIIFTSMLIMSLRLQFHERIFLLEKRKRSFSLCHQGM